MLTTFTDEEFLEIQLTNSPEVCNYFFRTFTEDMLNGLGYGFMELNLEIADFVEHHVAISYKGKHYGLIVHDGFNCWLRLLFISQIFIDNNFLTLVDSDQLTVSRKNGRTVAFCSRK